MQTSGQGGGLGKQSLPPLTTTAKITPKIQNKFHPDMSESPAVWKSDNQGFKEATFIQMGRRAGVAETGREAQRGSVVQRANSRG